MNVDNVSPGNIGLVREIRARRETSDIHIYELPHSLPQRRAIPAKEIEQQRDDQAGSHRKVKQSRYFILKSECKRALLGPN